MTRLPFAWLWALAVACGGAQPDAPEPPPPAADAPPSTPTAAPAPTEPQAETEEQRRARLNREADRKAGIDPDKPLPKWNLSAMEAQPEPPPKPCAVGAHGALVVQADSAPGAGGDLATLKAGPAAVPLDDDAKHKGAIGLSVVRLLGGAGSATAVSCDGAELVIDAALLSPDTRLLLVQNKRGQLKLVDQSSEHQNRPLARHVTLLRR